MKVLITGSGGFIGTALLHHLKSGYPDIEIHLLSSTKRTDLPTVTYSRDAGGYHFEIDGSYDAVLHLGAWTPKSGAEANDIEGSCSNIAFTEQLMKTLSGRVDRFIFASTLDVYSADTADINESSEVIPISLYGDSKLFCERMVSAWCRMQNIPSCILRLGHIYGEGERAYRKMIPTWISNAVNGLPITIFSDGSELRSFLYIGDCVEYLARTLKRPELSGTYNIVSGNAYAIMDIAGIIKDLVGSGTEIRVKGESAPARSLSFNTRKLKETFGLKETDIREGLKREVEYFLRRNG